MAPEPPPLQDIHGARVLVMVGDSLTTDHISPAGSIARSSPAAQYLVNNDVEPRDFNSYGARRGNHQVMVRGTFANIRLRNLLAPGKEGNVTIYFPTGEEMSIYDASYLYQREGVPLIVLGGKEYGTGSSRDWAAKGPMLLGIKAVIAESYERIHRSNLVGMGVLPLQFKAGESPAQLGLDGTEVYAFEGIADGVEPREPIRVTATRADGTAVIFDTVARIDSNVETDYYRNGGILQTVLRRLMAS
jgi:aconitate hydratase